MCLKTRELFDLLYHPYNPTATAPFFTAPYSYGFKKAFFMSMFVNIECDNERKSLSERIS